MTTWKKSSRLCAIVARSASVAPDLSPVGKRSCVCVVDFWHFRNGKGQTVSNRGEMINFIEGQQPALARLQISVEYLMAGYAELPNYLRNRTEILSLVNPDCSLFRRIAHSLDRVISLAMIGRQTTSRKFEQQVCLRQGPTHARQSLEIFR